MIQHKWKLYLACLVTIFVIASCIDRIDFDVPAGTSDSVVVEGRVVKGDPSYVEISVSRLFDFSADSRRPITLKKVTLFDTEGNEMELETKVAGYYRLNLDNSTPIKAEIGTGYKMRMELLDNRVFESEIEMLETVPDPIQLNVGISQDIITSESGTITNVDRLALTIDTNIDRESGAGMFWEVFNIFKITDSPIDEGIEMKTCYLTQLANVNDIYVLDPTLVARDVVQDFPLRRSQIDFRFSEGLYYEVHQYSLSPGAFKYWNAIDILSEREGNMFDGPVGVVPTNLVNIDDPEDSVFGYFFASEEKVVRIKVPQELVGNPDPHCPPSGPARAEGGGACLWGICCDCIADPTATLEKPDFWID